MKSLFLVELTDKKLDEARFDLISLYTVPVLFSDVYMLWAKLSFGRIWNLDFARNIYILMSNSVCCSVSL